jgi:hypothetical protein
MKHTALLATLTLALGLASAAYGQRILIDHRCVNSQAIPAQWLDSAKANLILHLAHKSHGRQLIYAFDTLASRNTAPAVNHFATFSTYRTNALNIHDFNGYVADYFSTVRATLNAHPHITTSLFVWCIELNWGTAPDNIRWTAARVQGYLDTLRTLEAEYPAVTFVYCTGTAYHISPESSYHRHLLNQQIRAHCRLYNTVLYDFEDIDSWAYSGQSGRWEQATISYNTGSEQVTVPIQHPAYGNPDVFEVHINTEGMVHKGHAGWWLMARLAGWSGSEASPVLHRPLSAQAPDAAHERTGLFTLQGRSISPKINGLLSTGPRNNQGAGCSIESTPGTQPRTKIILNP